MTGRNTSTLHMRRSELVTRWDYGLLPLRSS